MAVAIKEELLKNLVVDVVNEVLPQAKGRNEGDVLNEIQNKVNDLIPVKFTESEGWKVELLPSAYDKKGKVATINFRIVHDYLSGAESMPYCIPLNLY
jgi:hypothetical protein